jgi:hypothetical protein
MASHDMYLAQAKIGVEERSPAAGVDDSRMPMPERLLTTKFSTSPNEAEKAANRAHWNSSMSL